MTSWCLNNWIIFCTPFAIFYAPFVIFHSSFLLDSEVGEFHGDDAADAFLLLADAIDEIRAGDGMLVVRDDEELRLDEEFLELFYEASDIGVVESGVEFVEHGEWGGLDEEDREEQRDGGHRSLTTG